MKITLKKQPKWGKELNGCTSLGTNKAVIHYVFNFFGLALKIEQEFNDRKKAFKLYDKFFK